MEKKESVVYKLDVSQEIRDTIEELRKSNAENKALFFTVDEHYTLELEDTFENVEMEDLADEVPLSEPRYILYSFKWKRDDGRVQYPLVLIYYKPRENNRSHKLNLVYSSGLNSMSFVSKVGKIFDIYDADEFTEEWLVNRLERISL